MMRQSGGSVAVTGRFMIQSMAVRKQWPHRSRKFMKKKRAIFFYNNEQVLRSMIKLAYFSYRDSYIRFEELPSGDGYADIVYLPKKASPVPVLVIERKWNRSARGAIDQIRDKKYPNVLDGYEGDILLVGIAYDKDGKKEGRKHTCPIEKA